MLSLLLIDVSGLAAGRAAPPSASASRKSDADARLSYSALVQDITFTVKGGLHEPMMNVTLDGVRQTIVALKAPASDVPGGEFGFVPPRPFGGSHRLGDVTLRVRQVGVASYDTLTTASVPEAAVPFAPTPATELAAANVTATLGSAGAAHRLTLERHYARASDGQGFRMWFTLANTGSTALEVGSWGLAMVFETMDTQAGGQRSLDELAGHCSMIDPSIIGASGWVSVTRMTGKGTVLMVAPEGTAGVQAWRLMREASGGRVYELMSHSKAYAEKEWESSKPWVVPTAAEVAPGASLTISYHFFWAPSVRDKEDALAAAGLAVLQAVPGYTIATDMANATLLVLPPRNATLQMVQATPASAVELAPPVAIGNFGYQSIGVTSTGFPIATHGRVAITLTFSDGSSTVASYHVLPPLDELVGAYGRFVTDAVNGAWYANMSDPFGRAPCVLGYNRDLKKQIGYHGGGGYEDHRIFNNGLSDESGAGANVGFAAKVSGQPTVEEVAKLDAYVTQTLYGVKPGLPFGASLQCVEGAESLENPSCGPKDIVGPTADGIMSSMFWVPTNLTTQPKMPGYDYDWRWFCDQEGTTPCPPGWPGWRWDQGRAASLGRAYNYPHQSSVYLAMYLALANYDLLKATHEPRWYLNRAYKTIVAMAYQACWYSHQGLMDGTNFWTILKALKDEDMTDEAAVVEQIMENRTLRGVENVCRFYAPPGVPVPGPGDPGDRGPAYPGCHWYLAENRTLPWAYQTGLPGAGSEFAWDTTGQEEAYVWGAYFGSLPSLPSGDRTAAAALARSALDQILAYTPLVPNWAWHGSSYGMGDFGNNGYLEFDGGTERILQHYRSGLNSIPSTEAFLSSPDDLYLLRLAAGSIGGVLTNIDPATGANSMGFHSDPANLYFDPASGDWGLALYGHTHNTQSFLVLHSDFGWQCYFCDVALGPFDGGAREGGMVAGIVPPPTPGGTLTLVPRDSYRRRVFIAPLGLQISSDAGTIGRVECDWKWTAAGDELLSVRVFFSRIDAQPLSKFRLRLLTRAGSRAFAPIGTYTFSRGAYEIPPAAGGLTEVGVSWK